MTHVAPNPDPLAILAGHSHCGCMGLALRAEDGQNRVVPLENGDPRFVGFTGEWPRGSRYWVELAAAGRGRNVVLVWGGNEHFGHYLFHDGRAFDFVLHEEPDLPLDEDAEIVADRVVHERMGRGMPGVDNIVRRILRDEPRRVVVCGTPPPRRTVELLRAGAAHEAHFRDWAARLGATVDTVPIASPRVMYKMWRVYQRHLETVATNAGALFVPVPPSTQDEGLLRDEYASFDVTHANPAYGAVMLDELHRTLSVLA